VATASDQAREPEAVGLIVSLWPYLDTTTRVNAITWPLENPARSTPDTVSPWAVIRSLRRPAA
jgi:hypothetical protein